MNNEKIVIPGVILASVIFVAGFFALVRWQEISHQAELTQWASDHGYTVVQIEKVGLFGASNDGPFWRRKNDHLTRAVLADHDHQQRVSFFRWVSWWGMEQAWKETQ